MRLVTEIEALISQITGRLAGTTTPRITGAGAQRLRQAVAATSKALQEAGTVIDDEQYPVAITRLETALAGLQKEFDTATKRSRP